MTSRALASPQPSLSSSDFAIASPTFSSIKEIQIYKLHLKPQTVLDRHLFNWWSFLLSSSSNDLFPAKFRSSPSHLIFHSPSALSLPCLLQAITLSNGGRACLIQAHGAFLVHCPPSTSYPVTSFLIRSAQTPHTVSLERRSVSFRVSPSRLMLLLTVER